MRNKTIPRMNLKKYISYFFINKTITKRVIQNRTEIHIGDITHHQDHVATAVTPINFSTINTIVNSPTNPIPLDDDDDDDDLPILPITFYCVTTHSFLKFFYFCTITNLFIFR